MPGPPAPTASQVERDPLPRPAQEVHFTLPSSLSSLTWSCCFLFLVRLPGRAASTASEEDRGHTHPDTGGASNAKPKRKEKEMKTEELPDPYKRFFFKRELSNTIQIIFSFIFISTCTLTYSG